MTELKPCPFCGGDASLYKNYISFYFVQCNCCYITTLQYADRNKPISDWNRRAEQNGKS